MALRKTSVIPGERPRPSRLHTKRDKSVRLVKGTFRVVDAKDVVLGLLTYKINFHELKDFSDRERFGRADERSTRRIVELKNSRRQLLRFLDEAELLGDTVRVDAVMKIHVARSPRGTR